MVHKLLERWEPARTVELANLFGQRLGATAAEVRAATEVALRAMEHPLLRESASAVQLWREYPICVSLATGELVEGVIDLAWSDGKSWTVVDYKTGSAEPQYRTQIRLYALALQRATGLAARAILLNL